MKRPFALIGITYLSVQAALFYLESDLAAAILTAVCFIGTIVSLLILKNRNLRHTVLGFCLTAAFASTIFSGYNIFVKQPIVDKYSEREIYVTATVLEQPTVQYDTYRYLIETDSINGKIEKLKICLSTINELNVEEFDRISCVLPLKECTKSQMIADGAFLQASVNKNFAYIVKKTDDKPLYYQAVKIRENFADSFEQNMSQDCASLCRAVLLGEKTALSQEIQNDFTRCGVSFLIVVSGMHLAIISSFVFLCIKKIIKNRVLRSMIMLMCAFSFMAVTGFAPSVVRAGVMLAVVYSGKMFMRKGDSLNSLGIAALILTVPNPTAVADVGMLLSFTATLGIILWARKITVYIMGKFAKLKRLKKPVEFTVNLFAVSVSAAVWTMPISVLMFGKVSVFSILLSVILSPAVSVLVACALLAVILYGFGIVSIIAYPLTFVCEQLSKYVIFIVGTFSDIPFSSVNARKPYFYIWLALIAVMVIVGYFVKNKENYAVKSAVISLCVLALGFAVYSVIDVNTTVINIYATGGNTVTVKRGKNCSVVSCGGEAANVYYAVSDIMEDTTLLDFLIVPSDSDGSLLYADIFQTKFDESDVLIYDSKGENEDNGNVKYFTVNKSFTLNLNSETKDEAVSTESGVYQYISTESTAVLLLDGNCKAEDILEKHRKADYIITDKDGDNLQDICGKRIITNTDDANAKDCEDMIFVRDKNLQIVID